MPESTIAVTQPSRDNELSARVLTRGIAIIALTAIALVHLIQLPDTYRQTPALGVMFIGLVLASMTIAAALVHTDRRVVWHAAYLTSAAVLAGYVLTRSMAVPFDRGDVGNWLEPIGLVALVLEASLIALCAYRLRIVSDPDAAPASGWSSTHARAAVRQNIATTPH
jgi:hypothetical protein